MYTLPMPASVTAEKFSTCLFSETTLPEPVTSWKAHPEIARVAIKTRVSEIKRRLFMIFSFFLLIPSSRRRRGVRKEEMIIAGLFHLRELSLFVAEYYAAGPSTGFSG